MRVGSGGERRERGAGMLAARFGNGWRSIARGAGRAARVVSVPLCIALVALASTHAQGDPYPPFWGSSAVHFAPVAWPAEPADAKQCGAACGEWLPYTRFQNDVADPRTQDPSNGGTSPQNYVNIASSCVDKAFPSIYYALRQGAAADGSDDVIMFRWRVEQIANTYATGPSAGAFGASDPWNSALWSVLFDVDGDGFIDLAAHLDGSSGAPSAAIDRIVGIWSKLPTQSLDYIGDPANVKLLAHNPTAFVDPATNRILNFQGSLAPTPTWPNGAAETRWDYGTTRSRVVSTSPCNEYFIDYQIPVRMLDASAQGGPKITRSTPISMLFCTANSLNNPFQKDCALNRKWIGASAKPAPFGDYVSFNQAAAYSQPIVSSVTASAPSTCPGTYRLTAKVQDTLAVVGGVVVPSVRAVRFFYYYDADGNGIADDGNAWTFAVDATLAAGSLNTWNATWDATPLPKGQYLIGVQALDDNTKVDDGMTPSGVDNRTFSYVEGDAQNRIEVGGVAFASVPLHSPAQAPSAAENWWGNPSVTGTQTALVGLANNACGVAPTLSKTASSANVGPGGTVDFTLRLDNPMSSPITLSELDDDLPAGFTFVGTIGGSLASTTSPTGGASGTLAWTFAPAATIPAGGSAALVFRANVPSVAGNYNNAANATTSFGVIASAPAAVAVDAARLSLSKTPSRYNVDPDGATQVVYTIRYANASTVVVTNAAISDALPAGASYVGCDGAGCSESTGTVTWPIGTLAAGASGSVSVTITVAPGYAGSSLTNVASLVAADAGGNALSQTAQAMIAVNQPTPGVAAITLAKSATATQVAPGATATWTIDYANAGTGTASGVTVVDPLPAGFTFAGCSGGVSCSNSAGTVTWNVGSLAAGASGTVSVSATAANPFTSPNPAANTASVDWTGNAGAPVSASAQIGVTGQACSNYYFRASTANVGFDGVRNLATRAAPTNATASSFSFNATTSPAEAARFYQDPPAAASVAFAGNITTSFYVTKSNGPQLKMDVLVYDYDPVTGSKTALGTQSFTQTGSGTNQLFTFTLPLSGTLPKDHRILWVFNAYSNNNTTFTFNFDGTGSPSGASFCVTPPPNLTLAKSVDKATATSGSATPVQYRLRFANTGQAKATATQIVDTLPSNVTFGSATLNGAPVVPLQSGQQLTFANVNSSTDGVPGEIASGATGTLVIAATIDASASGTLTNQASIASNETAPVTSSASTTLSSGAGGGGGTPSLAVSLAADRASAAPGDVVTYTVTVVNVGTANAANVQVTDVLPVASYYAFGACSGGCVNGAGTLTWNAGTLAPGASASYTFTMQAGSVGLPAGITIVSDTASAQATSVAPVPSETVDVALNGNPRLVVAKSATPAAGAVPGTSIAWTLTVTNAGNAPATAVRVVDPIPAATTFAGGVTASVGSGTFDAVGNRVVFDVGTLPAGATATLGFATTLGALPAGPSTVSNLATASAANAATATATATVSASATPVLVLSKRAPVAVAYPAASLAAAANGTALLVNDASQLAPGGFIAVAGTVVQVQDITGHRVGVSAPIVAASGTPVVAAIDYALTVTNAGDAIATNVSLTDPLPAGTTFVAATDAGAFAAGAVTWNLGDLAVGASRSVSVTLLPGAAGAIVNDATAACNACAPAAASVATSAGGLVITKRTTSPTARAGNTATYVIDAQNTSSATIANVQIDDVLPPGFSYSSTTSVVNDGTSVVATVLPAAGDAVAQWGTFSIAAGKTLSITFVANIASTAGAATYENGASALPVASTVAYDALAGTADDVTVLAASTGIVQGRVYRDNDNDGAFDAATDTPLTGIAVTITDATATSYVVVTDGDGSFSRVVAAGNASVDVDDGMLPSNVVLRGGFADPSSVNVPDGGSATRDTAYVDAATGVPDLALTKTHTGNFTQGQLGAAYTLIVSNVGTAATTGTVTVVDTLPAGLAAMDMSGIGWTCGLATPTCTRSDALAAGASYPAITLRVNVATNAPPSVTNVASVGGGGESNAANDAASDPTTIAPVVVAMPADLAITNTHAGTFTAGQVGARFVIGVSNVGSGPTSGVVDVTYTLPAGLTATAITGTGWSCSIAPLACTRNDSLAAGASFSAIDVTVDVASDASSPLTTVARVGNAGDGNAVNDVAPDTVDIVGVPPPPPPPPEPVAATPVPTLNEWALMLLALLVVAAARRKRRRVSADRGSRDRPKG